ncbi:hypothetical protein [Nocardiopsis alba]|uniref:Putative dNA integrase/recombinase n=1 Tax=Nocardiopsis alba (strain ATCC BAA-2165 / BE74) TaxID=1205910 RepID=J7L3X6_NOCAA|nr:hypothetical protein [Nocardiopsis alba]AFR07451.1 putative dNA integrase/recombinase [Nocardiopsis alba ATCC BAA-2165]
MHQRIRERLPHLPTLVDTAEKHREEQAALLDAARRTPIGETFEHDGRTCRRTQYRHDTRSASQHGPDAIVITDEHNGERTELLRKEEDAFWAWAIIETLRHTGVRIEELLELTHLTLVSYRLPDTGEVVPLLQIVPSKSNEERLLLVTPEPASVICRIRGEDGRVPLTARYDAHERVTGPRLPHLFQRKNGWRREIISTKVLYRLLDETLERAGLTDRAGQPLCYTAARLPPDVHQGRRHRRPAHPTAEYRGPTEQEWNEFQQHFELRKVEFDTCGRPLRTRACLCALPHAPCRPSAAAASGRDHPQPRGPCRGGPRQRLARRGPRAPDQP